MREEFLPARDETDHAVEPRIEPLALIRAAIRAALPQCAEVCERCVEIGFRLGGEARLPGLFDRGTDLRDECLLPFLRGFWNFALELVDEPLRLDGQPRDGELRERLIGLLQILAGDRRLEPAEALIELVSARGSAGFRGLRLGDGLVHFDAEFRDEFVEPFGVQGEEGHEARGQRAEEEMWAVFFHGWKVMK